MLTEVDAANRRRHRKGPVSDATLAKHLRTLSVCLEDAKRKGHLTVNPVSRLSPSEKPKARRGEPSYFEDAEVRRIFAEPTFRLREPYWFAARLAVTTGMRFGELAGLRVSDVRLLDGELLLRRQWTGGEEVDTTKGGRARILDLVPAAREVLEEWLSTRGFGEGLLFEREIGGHLDNGEARKLLYSAMDDAGVDRLGEHGGSRDWHSLRHSFARMALENGALIQWVQSQLGHSSSQLTTETYGRWSRVAQKREAERLAAAFVI
jgi:integrase